MNYDKKIIQEFAEKLYAQAELAVVLYTVVGGLFGTAGSKIISGHNLIVVIGAVAGAIIGFALGRERALALKVQAQTALCQMQIEENTRKKDA